MEIHQTPWRVQFAFQIPVLHMPKTITDVVCMGGTQSMRLLNRNGVGLSTHIYEAGTRVLCPELRLDTV